ncbi:Uncharacterized protein HZ326_29039, partial [Fusarium oxysporum f. sp. albedinis]
MASDDPPPKASDHAVEVVSPLQSPDTPSSP